jgi:hypothetical protein
MAPNLSVAVPYFASQKELFTTFSFNDSFLPIHVDVNLAAPPRGRAAEHRVFPPTPRHDARLFPLAPPASKLPGMCHGNVLPARLP